MPRNAIDITGQVFGKLTVVSRQGTTKYQTAAWLCQCECGNTVTVSGTSLRHNDTKSCGCLRKLSKGSPATDITGKTFGRWTVLTRAANRGTAAYWVCICQCGTQGEVSGSALRTGTSQSCGCYQQDVRRNIRGVAHPRWTGGRAAAEARRRKEQRGPECEICHTTEKLCWDHNHQTGNYRGTLCDVCNRVLGFFKDDPSRFEAAFEYLKLKEER